MTQIGILNDDELNRDKAIELSWSTSDEALDECVQESNGSQTFLDILVADSFQSNFHAILCFQIEQIRVKKPIS